MKYKPTEEILIAYLYGDLDQEQSFQVEAYLEANPEEKSKLEGLSDTRMIFNELEDEEVPSQLAFMAPIKNEEWLYWRRYVGIAATLLVILTFGWITGFKEKYGDNGLFLGYGEVQNGLTEEQVASMIYDNNESISTYMEESLRISQDSVDIKFKILQANNDSEANIKKIFDEEKGALINQMVALNNKLSGDYRELMRQIVVNFSNNIETQRIDDLKSIQAAFTDLEDATIGKQFELENALSQLDEKINTVAANNSNNK